MLDAAAPRVFSAPASADFLAVAAQAIVGSVGFDDPLALHDTLILAPNRRSGRALAEAIADACGGSALLPTIRPLADLEDDFDVWGADPVALQTPPVLSPLRRRLELAQLLRARDRAEKGVAEPVRAIAFADELCRVLDAASIVEPVDWSMLPTLVDDAALAQHWLRSVAFLEIVTQYWPQRLAAEGVIDAADRRSLILRALASHWREQPPATPIFVVGSTGSIAATRALMNTVVNLPRGAVIFPGLDADLDDQTWDAIQPQHPQFHLRQTLQALGVDRRDVKTLPGCEENGHARARRLFVREALAPAETTADWRVRLEALGGAAIVRDAAHGLTLVEAANEDEEASVIAIAMRRIAETPEETAALVTPDASLARRVEAKLHRWGIVPLVTIGFPLAETSSGRFVLACAEVLADCGDPLTLAQILSHPFCALGLKDDVRTSSVRAFVNAHLRGPRRHRSLDDLVSHAQDVAAPAAEALRDALSALVKVGGLAALDLPTAIDAIIDAIEALAQSPESTGLSVWANADGAACASLLAEAAAHGAHLGPIAPRDAPRLLAALMAPLSAPPQSHGSPRFSILGPLEARVLRRDLIILGGLNEGVWPAAAPEDAFLSRRMRDQLGLASPDARLGLAAHDFAQAANAPHVMLTRSERAGGAPTVASRWVWRLRTLANAAGERDCLNSQDAQSLLAMARSIDAAPLRKSIAPPQPRPPVAARPKRISFSEVETLVRDPYAVYARRVLGLRVLASIGAPAGAAERGTAIHAALDQFGDGDDPIVLRRLVQDALLRAGFDPVSARLDVIRIGKALDDYTAWSVARQAAGVRAFRERPGRLELKGGVVLAGQADRIDIDASGQAAIIDFKTGDAPKPAQITSGLAPQLTLEAAVVARGGFDGVVRARAAELFYIKLGAGGVEIAPLALDAYSEGEDALARLMALMADYDRQTQPYLSKPRVQFIKKNRTDYDHLARRLEWADAEGDT